MSEEKLLTREEVMDYLRISKASLYRLMKQKAFPYIKFERKVLFRKKDIDEFLESRLVK
jgi:excisionase family DNA binding protein